MYTFIFSIFILAVLALDLNEESLEELRSAASALSTEQYYAGPMVYKGEKFFVRFSSLFADTISRVRSEESALQELGRIPDSPFPRLLRAFEFQRCPGSAFNLLSPSESHRVLIVSFVESKFGNLKEALENPEFLSIISVPEFYQLFIKRLADQVELMHRNRVIHRDLYSINVIVNQDNFPVLVNFHSSLVVELNSAFNFGIHDQIDWIFLGILAYWTNYQIQFLEHPSITKEIRSFIFGTLQKNPRKREAFNELLKQMPAHAKAVFDQKINKETPFPVTVQ